MKPNNIASGQLRVLRVLKALKGHSLTGLSNVDLANGLNESPANISRALDALIHEGLATKFDNGRYALSVQMISIATHHALAVEKANIKLGELNQRILAGARQ